MKWDIKGNMLMHNKDGHNIGRFCWTEDNRLQAAHGYQTPVFYNYAASGDRNLKLTGEYVNVWVNGGNANIPVLNNQVLYASALVTINNKEYTKHYYEEGRRIASAIGGGGFNGTQDLVEPIVDDYETQINNQNEGLQSTFTNCLPNMTVNIQTDNLYELTVQSNEPIIIPNEPHYYYLTDHLGSTSYIVNDSAQITQKLAYMPFGEDFVDLNYNTPYPPLTPFRFNGKEKDEETGFNYFGARYYYPDWGWISVDPLAHKYPHLSPYVYCANNPLKYIDPNGMYPKSILKFNSNLGLYGGYKFTKSATHLLSLVTGVSKNYIENTTVQERAVGQYRPFYKANKGGGAITMGRSSWNANITFTENWFDDNKNSYDGHGYGQDVIGWLELAAHEIGHIPQIDKGGGLLGYLATFAKEYMQNSHDNAPSEKEADRGREEFINFNDFVDKNYGNGAMKKLFKSKVSEDDKIKKIDNWWNHYKNSQKSSNGYE